MQGTLQLQEQISNYYTGDEYAISNAQKGKEVNMKKNTSITCLIANNIFLWQIVVENMNNIPETNTNFNSSTLDLEVTP